MKILAIEASTEQLSIALYVDGQVKQLVAAEPRRHAEAALPMIDQLLADAGIGKRMLDAIAFGRGPGAFTGVRLACSMAQGLGFGLDRPTYGVSSLETLARRMVELGAASPVLALLDARMGELYAAGYALIDQRWCESIPEQLVAPKDLTLPGDDQWQVAGSGWLSHQQMLQQKFGYRMAGLERGAAPDAVWVARIAAERMSAGIRTSVDAALPVYLRDKVAFTTSERLQARG